MFLSKHLAQRNCNAKVLGYVYIRFLATVTPCKCKKVEEKDSSTMKVLNVAEKNDAAKNIAGFLSGGNSRRREGFSKFNKIYEFNYNVMGQHADMVMTSVSGHLLQLDFPGHMKSWKSCSPIALFEAPVHKFCPENYQQIKRTLEREVRSCHMLIIWTDCDREGENIGYEIIDTCRAIKPNLQVYRAKFSEITAQSIHRAMQSLERPNKLLSDAVDVRSELDLRIGAAFTRFQTLRLQQVFPQSLSQRIISYGSCQFPTLGFVVERYKAIESFIPEPFWKISVLHTVDETSVDFSWKRVRLFDQMACQVLFDIVTEQPTATVEKVVSKPKSKWRPVPLDTIELEKQASRKLKLTAKETMRVAEKLYTSGFISYPRTETNIFPKDFNLAGLIEQQCQDNLWGAFARRLLEDGPNPRQGKKSDQAHPPIHPTKYADNLQGNEKRVYEFVVRHFLACCSKDAQGHETIVDIDINGEKFVASGLMILARNYLEVYPYEKWNAKEIHQYQEGQTFQPTNIEMTDGETAPPKALTEADLITLMEKHGIGTDATHAEHIETIKAREYVGLDQAYLLPGNLGLGLVDGYDNMANMGVSMVKPYLRAELEADLQRITQGTRDPQEVLREQLAKYKRVFEVALAQASKIDTALAARLNEDRQAVAEADDLITPELKQVCRCSACGQEMVLKTKRDNTGFYISCMAYPHCRNTMWLPNSVEHVDVSQEACAQCGPNTKKLNFRFKRGSYTPYYPDNYTSCVGGCDTHFLETLGIQRPRQPNSGTNNSSSTAAANTTNNNRNNSTFSASTDSGFSSFSSSFNDTRTSRTQQRGGSSRGESGRGKNTINSFFSNNRNTDNSSRPNTTNGGDTIVCRCNVDAIQLTVRKEGPNQGRPFYKCGNNSSCDYFLWGDEDPPSASLTNNAPSNHSTSRADPSNAHSTFPSTFGSTAGDEDVKCTCGDPAKFLTVQKEGPNKGRQFYACAKPRDSQCNFFQWADVSSQSSSSGSSTSQWGHGGSSGSGSSSSGGASWSRGGGNARGRGNKQVPNFDAGSKGKRKCGVCGQEGHNRKNCPSK